MSVAMLSLLLAPVLGAPLDEPAVELRYSGTLSSVSRDGGESAGRKFDVYYLLQKTAGENRRLAFLVDERGDGWPWPERFGQLEFDANHQASGARRPQLLQLHDGNQNAVPILLPLFPGFSKLKDDAEWTEGKFSYVVQRRRKIEERDCWQIEASTNFGRAQSLTVEADSGLVVTLEQKLFMGRGDQYALKMQLDSVKPVDAASLAKLQSPLESLLKLQQEMKRPENEMKPELTADQLQLALAAADKLEKDAASTPFERLTAVIAKDARSQSQRVGDVESIAKKFVGSAAPAFTLKTLGGSPIDPEDYKDKILVLHFYKYHGEPLQEPYGQVGYLDFLNNKRKKLGVQIYGVAVDERFGEAATAPAAARQARKFIETMNLSYPVTSDAGALLEKFGDPRRVGAKLPLWVVIGGDGKVAHYKAGYYEINPDEGLKKLDESLIDLIRKQRNAEKSE